MDKLQGFRSSPSSANIVVPALDFIRKVEAKYPALLFKQQLTAYVEKIYGIIRDNLKKELTPLLQLCIQVCWNPVNNTLTKLALNQSLKDRVVYIVIYPYISSFFIPMKLYSLHFGDISWKFGK